MKRLILLRHGKSDWDAGAPSDHARPLSKRGVRAARAVGHFLARAGAVPDVVLTSSAVRARTTAELAVEAGRWPCPIEVVPALYGTSAGDVVRLVRQQEEHIGAVMLVGHEPTWSTLASLLTGGTRFQVKTATAIALDFTSGWSGMSPGDAEVAWVIQARMIATDGWDYSVDLNAR